MNMVLSGADRLETVHCALRRGRVGLMTNQTGIGRDFRPTIDLIREKYRLTALFAVEHGIRGDIQAGEKVSAYQENRADGLAGLRGKSPAERGNAGAVRYPLL